MTLLIVAASSVGLSQLLLSLLLLSRLERLGRREWLFTALLAAAACYLLAALFPGAGVFLSPWATAIPGLFWLFSSSVFDDHFRLTTGRWIPVVSTVALPIIGMLLGRPELLEWLLFTAPQMLEFVLLALALWVVIQHWSTDLVESRRRLRFWFVGLTGVGVSVLILAREVFFPEHSWLAAWQYVFVAGLLFAVNLVLLGYRTGALFDQEESASTWLADPGPARSAGGSEPAVDRSLVTRIQSYMEDEYAWREMGLTIGQLADRLEVPQYRLRHAINVGLGYRNVSDFLNSYRIREASGRLAGSADSRLPVLTIAMDAGFRSLSSFNKAFKEAHGITPTQYRKAQSESA